MPTTKPVSTIRGLGVIFLMLVAIFVPVISYTYYKNQSPPVERKPNREERGRSGRPSPHDEGRVVHEHLQSFKRGIFSRHPESPSDFWLSGEEDPATTLAKIEAYRLRLIELLVRVRGVSMLAQEIVAEPVDLRVGLFSRGAPMELLGSRAITDIEAYMRRLETVPGIVVIPYRGVTTYRFPTAFYYESSWSSVSLFAVKVPDAFLAAILIHELGHRLRRVQNAPSGSAPNGSDLWISEEVEMHALEHEVLDSFVEGRLSELYERIRQRASDPQSAASVLLAVNEQDIIDFERIFEIEDASGYVIGSFVSQFYLGLGFHTVDATGGELPRKIEVYRLVSSQ